MFPTLLLFACADDPPPQPTTVDSGSETSIDRGPPNILVFIADDLGTDRVGLYDVPFQAQKATTPVLDALAADGLVFETAYAAPSCSPARAGFLTGRLPRQTGVGGAYDVGEPILLDPEEQTLPELLRDQAGYTTAFAGKWHLASAPSDCAHPIETGFDWYAGSIFNFTETGALIANPSFFHWDKCVDGTPVTVDVYATTDTANDAVERIESMPEPWFLVVSFNAPHIPFHTPPEDLHYQGADPSTNTLKFLAMTEALDTEMGRVIDALTPEQRANTNIVFFGDNGTSDTILPLPELYGKGQLREGGLRVPLVLSGPDIAAGRTAAWAQLTDLLPTFLGWVDGSTEGLDLYGQDLGPVLADPSHGGPHDVVFWERWGPNGVDTPKQMWNRSLRDDRWKVILRRLELSEMDQDLFFDLQAHDDWDMVDLLEAGPLSAEAQAAYDRLKGDLEARWPVQVASPEAP